MLWVCIFPQELCFRTMPLVYDLLPVGNLPSGPIRSILRSQFLLWVLLSS